MGTCTGTLIVGANCGASVDPSDREFFDVVVGTEVGALDGIVVGSAMGLPVGLSLGSSVGLDVGTELGT